MKGFGRIFVFALATLISGVARPQENGRAAAAVEDTFIYSLQMQVREVLVQKRFDELEQWANEFRTAKPRCPSGYPLLGQFYSAFGPKFRTDASWKDHIANLRAWLAAKPDSVSARIALANALVGYGWHARGIGFADTVSEESWRVLSERLAEAKKLLAEAERLSAQDPELYCVAMFIAMAEGATDEQFDSLFEKALKADPRYYRAYVQKMERLQPKWGGGAADAWEKFAANMATAARADEGDSLYTRLILYGSGSFGLDSLKSGESLDRNSRVWQRTLRGYRDLELRWPGSLLNGRSMRALACMVGDRELAHEIFEHTPNDTSLWRQWADPNMPAALWQPRAMLKADGEIFSVSFSPDGHRLAVGTEYGSVTIWDTTAGKISRTLEGPTHPRDGRTVSFSPDGKTVAAAAWDYNIEPSPPSEIRLWDAETGEKLATLSGHSSVVRSLAFAPNGKSLVSVGANSLKPGEVFLWEVATGRRTVLPTSHRQAVWSVAFSPDGEFLALGSWMSVGVWSLQKRNWLNDMQGRGTHPSWVHAVAFSPDGGRLATGGGDYDASNNASVILLWETQSGRKLAQRFKGHHGAINTLAFSPDGKWLASGAQDATAKLWDVATTQERATLLGFWREVRAVTFSPDGKTLATGDRDGYIKLWDADAVLAAGEKLRAQQAAMSANRAPRSSPLLASEIHDAARRGDLDKVRTILDRDSNAVHAHDEAQHTPLHWAAGKGQRAITALLIDRRADPNARARDFGTPLHEAAFNGQKEIVELLLAHQADANAQDACGFTPLLEAIYGGHSDVARLLLDQGANANGANLIGTTPLEVAIWFNQPDAVAALIEHKVAIPERFRDGSTPMTLAAHHGDGKAVELLLTQGQDALSTADDGWQALHVAAWYGHKELVESLLRHGASLIAKTRKGQNPLACAVENSQLDIARILRRHGANYQPQMAVASEDLRAAAAASDAETVKAILRDYPELVNAEQDRASHWSVLHEAASEGRTAVVQALLEAGAEPNVVNNDRETPLHWAVRRERREVVELLLSYGAHPNAREAKNQRTSLHEAAFRGRKEIVSLLLDNSADPNLKDKAGKTALFYASDENHKEIADLLRARGAND